jgi:hypothetical protein
MVPQWLKRVGDGLVIAFLIALGLLGLRVALSLVLIGLSG